MRAAAVDRRFRLYDLRSATSLYATLSREPTHLTLTTTDATTNAILPRVHAVLLQHRLLPVRPGQQVTLSAEVRHSRGLPMLIDFWPVDAAGNYIGGRPVPTRRAVDGWVTVQTTWTMPAGAAWLGWQVCVDSSTPAGPSEPGDVFEVRHIRVMT